MSVHVRPCGECEACCIILGVKEIGKYAGQECPHQLKGKGCAIHETKPEECRKFSCVWPMAKRVLTEKDRPDKCGVMLLDPGPDSAFTAGTGIHPMVVHEVFPGAFETYHGQRVVKKLSSKLVLILVQYGGLNNEANRRVIGPPVLMRRAGAWFSAQDKGRVS